MRFSTAVFLLMALTCRQAHAGECAVERQAVVPITFAGFTPTVPAEINGNPVMIGLDTGSTVTVLTPETAERLQLPRDPMHFTGASGTAGTSRVNNVFLDNFEFGGAQYVMKTVAVIAVRVPHGNNAAPSPDAMMAGLVGSEILSNYDLEFDPSHHRLSLYSVSGCASVTPPWRGPFISMPAAVTATRQFIIPVTLDGHRLTAMFDTGASGLRLTRAAALRIGVTSEMLAQDPVKTNFGVGDSSYNAPSHQFAQIAIGNELFSGPRIGILELSGHGGADMLIGEDYMHNRRFWLSYATHRLFIQRLSEPVPQK